ncbi:MAG: YciI family protein [Rhodanobacteraceae bacterium]|nr:MAG: YciI family protein [Rhodanobacteraceae bacterium]
MRVLVMVKASGESEAGGMPTAKDLAEMGKFNEKLVEAGVMLMADGLHPSSKGVRVRFEGKQRTVIDGPFSETKELVAGFWLWQVRSMEEAIEWIKRAPCFDGGAEIELRPVFEQEDFGDAVTPEARREYETKVLKKAAKLREAAARR